MREIVSDVTYDAIFKRIFSRRDILAIILKGTVAECSDYDVEYIASCIEKDTDNEEFAKVLSQEESRFGSKVLFDIVFECMLEGSRTQNRLTIDLEMQRKYNMNYPIVKRGIYYASTLLAKQSVNGDYSNLHPVNTIWITLHGIPKDLQNTVTQFNIAACNDSRADVSRLEDDADLIRMTLITLSDDFIYTENDSEIVQFLQAIIFNKLNDRRLNAYENITDNIREEVQMLMTKDDELRMEIELEKEEGREEGRAEGREEGREEGRDSTILELIEHQRKLNISEDAIKSLIMSAFNLSAEAANDYLNRR